MMKNMPENWEPPVDAWQSSYTEGLDEIVFAYFGIQGNSAADMSDATSAILAALSNGTKPAFVTRAHYIDASGYKNDIFIAYWSARELFDAWWMDSGLSVWWENADREASSVGIWREIFTVPTTRFETLFSSKNPTGVAMLGEEFDEPVREHNYWGGMRDRIADSAHDTLESQMGHTLAEMELKPTRGNRVFVEIPNNLCLIRSGQNWSDSSAAELETYLDVVKPNLTAGMAFLRDNPVETGCISCRLMDEITADGAPLQQSFGLALFISMQHLEDWSKTHPTHLAIFGSFFQMLEKHEGQLDLKLWHEVLIVDGQNSICEYVNCHPRTGMLPYF